MIHGVLVEGVDYIGKSSVCDHLAEVLGARDVRVRLNRCYLERNEVIRELERTAKTLDDAAARDLYYTAAISVDLLVAQETWSQDGPDAPWLVQDRHWLTQVGRNRFFAYEHDGGVPIEPLAAVHIPFSHNVLLQSDSASKQARAGTRPPKSPRDRELRANPDRHQEYDRFLTTLVPEDENWLVLDTTGLTMHETAERILEFVGDAPYAFTRTARSASS